MNTRRLIYSLRYAPRTRSWAARRGGRLLDRYRAKDEGIRRLRIFCRAQWSRWGRLAQLRIFGKNGRIQTEYTYGKDPRRTRG